MCLAAGFAKSGQRAIFDQRGKATANGPVAERQVPRRLEAESSRSIKQSASAVFDLDPVALHRPDEYPLLTKKAAVEKVTDDHCRKAR